MTDTVSKEKRSENMRSVRSKNTRLEQLITTGLWRRGIRFRKNQRKYIGCPDIVIKKYKIAIFIDSCFWHGCELHGRTPKSNIGYWQEKLRKNKLRDAAVSEYYRSENWNLLRIWEHEINESLEQTLELIAEFIYLSKRTRH